jgi:hypothetical protein
VRVHISRLRQRLREYYENDWKNAYVRLELPRGGYRLTIVEKPSLIVAEPAPATPPVENHREFPASVRAAR